MPHRSSSEIIKLTNLPPSGSTTAARCPFLRVHLEPADAAAAAAAAVARGQSEGPGQAHGAEVAVGGGTPHA